MISERQKNILNNYLKTWLESKNRKLQDKFIEDPCLDSLLEDIIINDIPTVEIMRLYHYHDSTTHNFYKILRILLLKRDILPEKYTDEKWELDASLSEIFTVYFNNHLEDDIECKNRKSPIIFNTEKMSYPITNYLKESIIGQFTFANAFLNNCMDFYPSDSYNSKYIKDHYTEFIKDSKRWNDFENFKNIMPYNFLHVWNPDEIEMHIRMLKDFTFYRMITSKYKYFESTARKPTTRSLEVLMLVSEALFHIEYPDTFKLFILSDSKN